jgi:hypothetical protein
MPSRPEPGGVRSPRNAVLGTGPVRCAPPEVPASGPPQPATGAPPQQRNRRRPAIRWLAHGVLLVALTAGVFGLLPRLGGLALAYAVANIASAFPITPGGLGVVEVTLVAISVGFGAPRPTAVLAVLGYRIVNYWLPLMPGAIAYLRLRLSPGPGRPGKPQAPPAGR